MTKFAFSNFSFRSWMPPSICCMLICTPSCSESMAGTTPEPRVVQLLAVVEEARVDLPLQWVYLRKWRKVSGPYTDEQHPHPHMVDGKFERHDTFVIDASDMEAWLQSLPSLTEAIEVELPMDARLMMRWEGNSTIVDFENAANVIPEDDRRSAIGFWEDPWPSTRELKLQRETTPPKHYMSWVTSFDPIDFRWGDEPIGLGFGGIFREEGGYFAASGDRRSGPDSSKSAWLHVARERESEDIILWYAEAPPSKLAQ